MLHIYLQYKSISLAHVRCESAEGLFSLVIDIIQREERRVGVALDEERASSGLGHLHSDLSCLGIGIGGAAIGIGGSSTDERAAKSKQNECQRKEGREKRSVLHGG